MEMEEGAKIKRSIETADWYRQIGRELIQTSEIGKEVQMLLSQNAGSYNGCEQFDIDIRGGKLKWKV